jgi:acyl transferase domain-containing protein
MAGRLPRALSDYVFDGGDPATAELLRDMNVSHPAMVTADVALMRLLARYGIAPDMAIGHSLGEYAALVAAGCLRFEEVLEGIAARSRSMADIRIEDRGRLTSVFAPEEVVARVLAETSGYVAAANLNSRHQTVIGGTTGAVQSAVARFQALGIDTVDLPVSFAFHTEIVAPMKPLLRAILERFDWNEARLPLISNVTGEPYPAGPSARWETSDLLTRQVASPVQFVRGLETLYRLGARLFVEVGPRKVLASFAEDVVGDRVDVVTLHTNNPKKGEVESFSSALAALYAAGLGAASRSSMRT